jgi:hypothetical protein
MIGRVHGLTRVALLALLTTGGDGFAAGKRAFDEGRYEDAEAAFTAAVEELGQAAPAELIFDQALAALAAGDRDLATAALQRAADRGGDSLTRPCEFLRGSLCWARGEQLATVARQPESEPFVIAQALEQVARARAHWVEAALGPTDWPAAARNGERAQRRLDELRRLQFEREQRRRTTGAQERPHLVPESGGEGDEGSGDGGRTVDETAANALQALRRELTAAEVAALFGQLEATDRLKRRERRARRAETAAGEQGW